MYRDEKIGIDERAVFAQRKNRVCRRQVYKRQIVSQEFIHNRAGNLTLFSFDEGQQLSEHTAPFDAVCQILDGEAEIHIAEDVYRLTEGQMLIMPANVPHSVHAVKAFKMLLIMIKG